MQGWGLVFDLNLVCRLVWPTPPQGGVSHALHPELGSALAFQLGLYSSTTVLGVEG